MNNEELMRQLIENRKRTSDRRVVKGEETGKFLVFMVDESKYAFRAASIKEIVMAAEIFYVPFVPPYIRGLINRHGEPYTIIDLKALFSNDSLESNKFLIMNIENDQIAFIMSDIVEIINIPCRELKDFNSTDSNNRYFSGSFSVGDDEVFIINLEAIGEKLEHDLQ